MIAPLLALTSLLPVSPALLAIQEHPTAQPNERTVNLGRVRFIRYDPANPGVFLQGTGPSPERIDAAAKALETAFKDGSAEARVEAIRASVDAVDKKVIELVSKGLKEKDGKVVSAAVDTLGRMRHPESAKSLVSYYTKEKKTLYKDHESELIDLLKAIGRQGDPAGIEALTDNVAGAVAYPVIQTRFMALGNIRDARAIEGILSIVTLVGPNTQDRYMDDVRLALMALTGEDRGKDALQWEAWWRDHKKDFKATPEMKPLPDAERARWNAFWGIEEKKQG